ncbi:hypothetical protein [Cohnella yongneupensis]|uniref:SMODS-associating 2TM beta-strand rich effector domain-containing protein n=1 Tax=Cohnella yongneupensis TaxID=425006 RepID=A0ABW0QWY7_9BACL
MSSEDMLKFIIGISSAIFSFCLGLIYNTRLQKKQFNLAHRSFAAISIVYFKDFHDVYKSEKARLIVTRNYSDIRDEVNSNSSAFPVLPKLPFLSVKNIGPGTILQCHLYAKVRVAADDFNIPDYDRTFETVVDFIEKDETVLLCLADLKMPPGFALHDEVDIRYRTQANEKIEVSMRFSEHALTIEHKVKGKLFDKKLTKVALDKGLTWEKPNK